MPQGLAACLRDCEGLKHATNTFDDCTATCVHSHAAAARSWNMTRISST
jgi:hypothetical protein